MQSNCAHILRPSWGRLDGVLARRRIVPPSPSPVFVAVRAVSRELVSGRHPCYQGQCREFRSFEPGVAPNIPPKINRRWQSCVSPFLYRDRNAIERKFGRIKDFRRIATRYARLAKNFLAAICLAATVSYWL